MRAIVRGPLGAKSITVLPPFIALGGRKLQITEVLHKIGMLYDSHFGKFLVSWLRIYLTLKDLGIKLTRICFRNFNDLAREISQKELSYLVTRWLTKGWSLIDEVNKKSFKFLKKSEIW